MKSTPQLAFYWSLSITQWVDVKRKDFLQNFVHHNVTILLMMFSWSCHFTRIGSLVLIIHDCSDPLLELAKLCKYAKRDKVAEVVFGVFTVLWCTMRCYVFPTRVLFSIATYSNTDKVGGFHFIVQSSKHPPRMYGMVKNVLKASPMANLSTRKEM